MKRSLPYIAIITAMFLWGTSPIATKFALESLEPLTLVTTRFLLAVTLMMIVGLLSGSLQKIKREHIHLFIFAGIAQPFLYYICETYGLKLSNSPTVSEVLLSTSPLFAPLMAYVVIKEKVTWNNIVGIMISTGGVLMMILAGNNSFDIGSEWGIVLLFAAVLCAITYTTLLRKIPQQYNSLSIVFYVQLISLIFFIPMWVVVDYPRLNEMSITWQPLAAVGYLAVFASVCAFILFCYTVRQIGVTRANAFNNIRPVFTALIMLLIFGEQLPWQKWVAIALVITGLFVCQYQRK